MKEWVLGEDASETSWDKVVAQARQTFQEELEFELQEDAATGGEAKDEAQAVHLFKEMWLKGQFENTRA